MRKQITYFDTRVVENNPGGETITVVTNNNEEYAATMAAIGDPSREIPQESITIEDLPPEIDPAEQIRADLDYVMIMGGFM